MREWGEASPGRHYAPRYDPSTVLARLSPIGCRFAFTPTDTPLTIRYSAVTVGTWDGSCLVSRGALNAALVSELPLARSGTGRATQGRARAKKYRRARIFCAVESASRGLLVKSARRGDRASGRIHPAGRREWSRQLAGA